MTCVGLSPRAEVELGYEGVGTGQQVLCVERACKRVWRHQPDVCVVADDAGEGDPVQRRPLGPAEHPLSLPPEPDEGAGGQGST